MNLRPKPLLAVAMFALGVVSTPALSQDGGWLIGGTGGASDAKQGCPAIPGLSCDDSSTGWRAFGGYRFGPHFGYEIGYADLGKVTQTLAGFAPATFESTAIDFVLVLTVPFGQDFSFFVKGGVFRWDLDVKSSGATTTSAHGADQTYGFGMHYDFTRNFALRLEWQKYLDIGDVNTTGRSDIEVISAGFVFKF